MKYRHPGIAMLLLCIPLMSVGAQTAPVPLNPSGMLLKNVQAVPVVFQGRKAVRVTDAAGPNPADGVELAILNGTSFQDGVIEVDLAGDTLPGSAEEFRGFTGIAFRVSRDGSTYECFYLRPKNGRSADQLQRNHSAQYMSFPEFPWQKLRQETPGKYESYVDLAPGVWTSVRIEVHGRDARLYVNGSKQPALLVNDLKHGESKGLVALWIGPRTLAHFSNLRITSPYK